MVEQDAVDSIHPITLAIVFGYPEAIEFGTAVRAAGIERCGFALRYLLNLAEQLRCARLIDAGFAAQAEHTHCLKQAESAHGVGVGSVFGHFKRHLYMTLCCKVVDFIGLKFLDDAYKRRRVGHIPIMKVDEATALHIAHPFVKI